MTILFLEFPTLYSPFKFQTFRNKSATNGFDWFYHKPDRSDPENKCKYVDESVQCNAKVKLTFDKDLEDNGTIQYEVRANPEGENHIEQAFVNDLSDLCENAVNTDPKWVVSCFGVFLDVINWKNFFFKNQFIEN